MCKGWDWRHARRCPISIGPDIASLAIAEHPVEGAVELQRIYNAGQRWRIERRQRREQAIGNLRDQTMELFWKPPPKRVLNCTFRPRPQTKALGDVSLCVSPFHCSVRWSNRRSLPSLVLRYQTWVTPSVGSALNVQLTITDGDAPPSSTSIEIECSKDRRCRKSMQSVAVIANGFCENSPETDADWADPIRQRRA